MFISMKICIVITLLAPAESVMLREVIRGPGTNYINISQESKNECHLAMEVSDWMIMLKYSFL